MNWSANITGRLRAGDKYWMPPVWTCVKIIVIALLMLLTGSVANGVAQDGSWSFAEHPHPTRAQLSAEDAMLIDQAYDMGPADVICERVVELAFQIYQIHYPDYAIGVDENDRLLNWKIHAVSIEGDSLRTCVYLLSVIAVSPFLEADFEPSLYYCGVYSRLSQTDNERELVKLFDEYEMLVSAGDFVGAIDMLSLNNMGINVMLNSDVHYYFSLLLEPFLDAHEKVPGLVDLSPDISDARKIFVEQAAANLDLQSVLDTTEPCVPKT